eukprot:ctg_561.g205
MRGGRRAARDRRAVLSGAGQALHQGYPDDGSRVSSAVSGSDLCGDAAARRASEDRRGGLGASAQRRRRRQRGERRVMRTAQEACERNCEAVTGHWGTKALHGEAGWWSRGRWL